MTSKEIAELLQVSKRTINKRIKALNIEPQIVCNRYNVSAEDAEKIIVSIYPTDNEKYIAAIKEHENIVENNENSKGNNEKIENKTKNNENKNEHTEKADENTEKSENDITERIIKMLEQSLADKENTIRAQQSQIDMLIKSNAMLTKRLEIEDKQQEQQKEIIVTEQKQSWFDKLFRANRNS